MALSFVTSSSKATPSAWNPRGPYSPLNCVSTLENAWQCGHQVNRNWITTTLPFRLDNRTCLPSGVATVNSLAGRGTGAAACAGSPNVVPSVINRANVAVRIKDSLPHPSRGLNPLDTMDGVAVQT